MNKIEYTNVPKIRNQRIKLSDWFWNLSPLIYQRKRSRQLTETNWQQLQILERDHVEYCPAFPEMLELELTKACNFTCTHCGTHGSHDLHRTHNRVAPMDVALLEQLAQDVFPYLRRVYLVGEGEPFMAPRHLLLRLCRQLERTYTFLDACTNGALLDSELISAMLPVLGDICFSLDAATQDTYYRVRRSKAFQAVIETIKTLSNLKQTVPKDQRLFQIHLSFALRKANSSELIEFLRMAAELQVDGVYVRQLFVCFPSMKSESLVDKPEIFNPLIEQAIRESEKLGLPVFLPAFIRQTPITDSVVQEPASTQKSQTQQEIKADPSRLKRVNCCFLWRCMNVRSTGYVFSCNAFDTPCLGNLKTTSLAEMWNGKILRDMRRRLDTTDPHPACRRCWLREVAYFDSFDPSDSEKNFSFQNVRQPKEKVYDTSSFIA